MVFGFYHAEAPGHVRNICKLAQDGFYDGLAFHRIIKGFMIQGGCPNTREGAGGFPGTGGPGYTIGAEFSALPHNRGVLSMARSQDPDSAGSQFFVVHNEHARSLDGQYTVFAYMKSGEDVLDAIASVEVDFGAGREQSQPKERIEITGMEVVAVEPVDAEAPDAGAEDGGAAEGIES
jgi:peptidyl-prolyl cis-trans isomerase B (cyclophilin B)